MFHGDCQRIVPVDASIARMESPVWSKARSNRRTTGPSSASGHSRRVKGCSNVFVKPGAIGSDNFGRGRMIVPANVRHVL